ncbi:MAG: SUMF1/EgtB/PvdO family nonheme iron enzyme, partial [Planctomycetota bacterium]|jgi:dienelactone hydrolase
LLLLVVAAGAVWLGIRASRVRWARDVALPEIARLAESQDFDAALTLVRRAAAYIPDDARLRELERTVALRVAIKTEPPGADVWVKQYGANDSTWRFLGTSPIDDVQVAYGTLHFRLEREGLEPLERTDLALGEVEFSLLPEGPAPPGMVGVPPGGSQIGREDPVELEAFWIDRFEVTNEAYRAFVDAGGYQKKEYWQHPFVREGEEITWEAAMAAFRDTTGRPGPSSWALGSYSEGEADHPVRGVSWYEAAAYAEFAGKSLPTINHWYRAASMGIYSDILTVSNFGGDGPAAVGSGLGPYGTYDMAGNVREWCFNRVGDLRYVLGGSWSEPKYKYKDGDAVDPFDRTERNGFRCMKALSPLPEALLAAVENPVWDFNLEQPVDDALFEVYRSLYAYDRVELEPRIEETDDTAEHWRAELISFRAAYGDERVLVRLFLPRNSAPPYQTVIYFPGSGSVVLDSSAGGHAVRFSDFLPRTGRALVLPIYKGTFERRTPSARRGPNARRDRIVQWANDLQTTLDYLETRDDIDMERLAYYGLSLGAEFGPIFTALDDRFSASVLLSGHLHAHQMENPPEAIPLHFAPRSTVPVLMINGDNDFITPVETSAKPMLRFQGAPDADKRLVLLEGGHVPPMNEVVRVTLDWLDRYLGPVEHTAPPED